MKLLDMEQMHKNQLSELQRREESMRGREQDRLRELEMKENSIKQLSDELTSLEDKQKKII